ncbi:MAG: Z1 domain-containing protein [Cyanobacteria bacterium SZAS LIN-3]|nr:Z1 domain-containing protein [Cyanobacteria bacterium SZAS LIN-3]
MPQRVLNDKDDYDYAKLLARTLLADEQRPQMSDISNAVDTAVTLIKGKGRPGIIDTEKLCKELNAEFNVFVKGEAGVLINPNAHEPWLRGARAVSLEWEFWTRYRDYLLRVKDFAPEPLRKLDEHSDLILEQMEDPTRPGPWSRRGLVVGQVQSGKTMNYTALINKAADAGYKLIIVLAGMWENLRYQTQGRLAEGFLGRETKPFEVNDDTRIGVGLIRSLPRAMSGTSRVGKGDFDKARRSFTAVLGSENPLPCLLVVKKNKAILNNVHQWIMDSSNVVRAEDGTGVIKDVPLLVIDDEADHASINTNEVPVDDDDVVDEDHNPTAINAAIRKLLSVFDKNAYVGYTATPFANIFIRHDAVAKTYGDDLFPRSFIVNLPAPSNYIGPAQLFGYNEDDPDPLDEHIRPKIICRVDDTAGWLPENHKNGAIPGPTLPDSLKRAIKSFVLVCAARIVRGQETEHNSMLVHVTRFTSVQKLVADQVKAEISLIQKRLKYSDGESPDQIHAELRKIWEEDFMPVSKSFGEQEIPYSAIEPHLLVAVGQIGKPKIINGTAKDVLDYDQGTVHAIAIGGNKLARGLTLEGLSISYYLRPTRMYDTLMQMGRWFGYRPGYRDLCKLFTTDQLVEWYEHISIADAELREEFDEMVDLGAEPIDYGLKVRDHQAGLVITALNKMQSGTPMKLSYDGEISETVSFAPSAIDQNFDTTVRFLNDLDSVSQSQRGKDGTSDKGPYIWKDVPGDLVAAFVGRMHVHRDAVKVVPSHLRSYIEKQVARGELTHWTVALVANGDGAPYAMGNYQDVKLTQRSHSKRQASSPTKYAIGRLLNPPDEFLDLDNPDQLVPVGTKHRNKKLRAHRDKKRGMLILYPIDYDNRVDKPIIGFALSFPKSNTAEKVDYVVTKLYVEQNFARV